MSAWLRTPQSTGVDPWFDEACERVRACAREQGATTAGLRLLDLVLGRATETRRLLDQSAEPGVSPEALVAPIFVVGLPRTGTTAIHRMLASSTWTTTLSLAATLLPLRPRATAIRAARHGLRLATKLLPESVGLHPLDLDAPEECWPLLLPTGASFLLDLHLSLGAYGDWLLAQDLTAPLMHYRALLERIVGAHGPHPFLSKAPEHLFQLEALLRIFPSARFVWTHRSPEEAVASYADLVAADHRVIYGEFREERRVAHLAHRFEQGLECGRLFAFVHPDRIHHVSMRALRENPEEVLERVAHWAGLERRVEPLSWRVPTGHARASTTRVPESFVVATAPYRSAFGEWLA